MVNGNDLIKHNYWPYIYLIYVFLNPDLYILKTEWYLDLYIAHCIYIFKRKNIADFFENVCILFIYFMYFIYPWLKYGT